MVEREAESIQDHLKGKAEQILTCNGFSPDGKLVEKTFETGKEEAVLSQETICTMIEELNAGNPKERHIDLCGRATLTGGRKSYETSKTGIHVIIL